MILMKGKIIHNTVIRLGAMNTHVSTSEYAIVLQMIA